MSRIGNKAVDVPGGVTVTIADRTVTIKGAKNSLSIEHRPEVSVTYNEDAKKITVSRNDQSTASDAFQGLTRSLINNMCIGVTAGYRKELDIIGVGWSANVQGRIIGLDVGYADTRKVEIPMGIDVNVSSGRITVSGADKQKVGQVAAEIRSQRPPEPYNGKGIKYADEVIQRKQGKAVTGVGG